MPNAHKPSASFILALLSKMGGEAMNNTVPFDLNLATFIGIDAHPSEHTALAINRFEEEKGRLRFENTKEGIAQFLRWLTQLHVSSETVIVGIEGGSGTRHALLTKLLACYEHVYEVNPLYTKQRRQFGTRRVKSDPVDAKLTADVLTRKLSELPRIRKEELSAGRLCCEKLVWFYEEMTRQATRIKNQQHQLQREFLLSENREEKQLLAEIMRGNSNKLTTLKSQQKKLTAELKKYLQAEGGNLLTMPGIGIVSAAKIITYTNGIKRFQTVDKFLSYAGIAPTEKSSGKSTRHKQNTKGNRKLNYALYWVAVNQLTRNEKAKAYFDKKVREGKSKKHALRCVMKRTACIIYGMLKSGEVYNG
jgi:transposase